MPTQVRAAALLLLGVALTGCVVTSSHTRSSSGTGPSVGQLAPDIRGIDADETSFALSDFRGKVVLLDFWGTH